MAALLDLCLTHFLAILLVSVFMLSESLAMGLGGYYTFGSGSGTWTINTEDSDNDDIDTDDSGTGFGFILDTAVAKDKLFNSLKAACLCGATLSCP